MSPLLSLLVALTLGGAFLGIGWLSYAIGRRHERQAIEDRRYALQDCGEGGHP